MSSTGNSIDQVIIVGLLAGFIVMILACRSRNLFPRVFLILLAVSLLTPSAILYVGRNPWLVDARFRNFKLLYWDIRIGMSRDEVISEIKDRYPSDGIPGPPSIVRDSASELEIRMPPGASGVPANDAIILRMEGGQVRAKSYSPDLSPGT